MRRLRPLALLAALLAAAAARAQTSTALDAKVQPPSLGAPQRGSVAGQLASVVFGPADVARGAFSLPAPFAAPAERGALLAEVFPTYSPDAGMGEWGMGWRTSLQVTRSRVLGDLDYATDELTGPWGRMIPGSDGYWYPVGLSRPVRLQWNGNTLNAWTPDGVLYTFGGSSAAVIASASGVYAWALSSVVTPTGRRTDLTWTANASGRLFLSRVRYGGVAADYQYQLDFTYEALPYAFTDERSGYPLVLDQRVKRVTVSALHATTGVLAERWHYDLTFADEGLGPASYLAAVQQTFSSGQQPPPVRYTYNLAATKLGAATLVANARVESVLAALGGDALQASRAAPLDADLDGQPDLEHATAYTLVQQTAAGFTLVPLDPAPAGVNQRCRRAPSVYNPPRLLAQLAGDDTHYVVDLFPNTYRSATALTVCNRLGQALTTAQTLTGDWGVGTNANVRLVDLNRDRKPDLIRVGAGAADILPNTSASGTFGFGAARRVTFTPAFTPDTSWVFDFNGDGLPDIVSRYSGGLVVWLGKGNYQFERTGRTYTVQTPAGPITTLGAYALTFVDANRDGLTDVILSATSGNATSLYVNRGTYFQQKLVPGFNSVGSTLSKPIVADLTGAGNSEVGFTQGTKGWAVTLDGPETGLMATADDGRGTVLSFQYQRAAPVAGARQREAVLASLSVTSSGYAPVTYAYDYAQPVLHSVGKFLLGFNQVSRYDPLLTEAVTFLNEDRYAGVLLSNRKHDQNAAAVDPFSSRSYEEAVFAGVPWLRLKQEQAGFRDATGTATIADTTDYLSWSDDFCPRQARRTNSAGVLLTTKTYVHPTGYGPALSCVANDVVESGAHGDASLDFTHETALTINGVGLTEKVEVVAGSRWTLETVTYRTDWLLQALSSPGKGSGTFNYDPTTHLLSAVTTPDGVVTSVLARDPATDGITGLRTTRGALIHTQYFAFDGQERLWKRWDDLGASSVDRPLEVLEYRFGTTTSPGSIHSRRTVDSTHASTAELFDLVTAQGEPVVTASRLPQGWAFGALVSRNRNSGLTARSLRPGTTASPDSLDYTALFAGATQVASDVAALTQDDRSVDRTTYHQGVERAVKRAFALSGGLLQLTETENDANPTRTWMDAGRRVLYQEDEAGSRYGYTYDTLGRLRRVTLPDGRRHTIKYDPMGRVWRVERDSVANVEYQFDAVTGLVALKRFLTPALALGGGPADVLVRSIGYTYDAAGRVRSEIHTAAASGATKTFTYYYDGSTPSANSTAARGLLTAVTGDGYSKLLSYRADGEVLQRTVTLTGWRAVETTNTYLDDGELGSRTTRLLSSGVEVAGTRNTQNFQYYRTDPATGLSSGTGRLEAVTSTRTSGGTTSRLFTATLDYDANGLASGATLSTGDRITLAYDALTRLPTGSTLSTSTFTSSVTRRMNARGLVDVETFAVGATSVTRQYGYSPQRFLTSATDAAASYGYGFDGLGVPTSITTNGVTRALTRAGNTLVVGGVTYVFDALGRVVKRGGLTLTYGPDGQVATASNGTTTWTFKYDEAGQRLLRSDGSATVAFIDDLYVTASSIYDRFKLGGRTVGYLTNGGFTSLATDGRGTVLAENNGTPRFASPFGRRDVHPGTAGIVDYVEKGYDAALGLVRMGVRDYDPEINQFLTPDPVVLEELATTVARPAEWTLYSYAANDPIGYVDPSGKWIETAWDVISLAVGVTSFVVNIKEGNYGWAAVDAAGIVYDGIAVAVPFLPAGVGAGLKAARAGKSVAKGFQVGSDMAKTAKAADKAAKAAELTTKAAQEGTKIHKAVAVVLDENKALKLAENGFAGANKLTGPRPDLRWKALNMWADLTTKGEWSKHVAKYTYKLGMGEGLPILYERGKGVTNLWKLHTGAGAGAATLQLGSLGIDYASGTEPSSSGGDGLQLQLGSGSSDQVCSVDDHP